MISKAGINRATCESMGEIREGREREGRGRIYAERRGHRSAQRMQPGGISSHFQGLSVCWFHCPRLAGGRGESDAPGFHGACNVLSPLNAPDKQLLEELGVAIIFPTAN